jgi:hypothetical protein
MMPSLDGWCHSRKRSRNARNGAKLGPIEVITAIAGPQERFCGEVDFGRRWSTPFHTSHLGRGHRHGCSSAPQ